MRLNITLGGSNTNWKQLFIKLTFLIMKNNKNENICHTNVAVHAAQKAKGVILYGTLILVGCRYVL